MAARKSTPELREDWRNKIKTSMLLNRLMEHVLGECEMSATQVKAAETLLKKTLPDIKAMELTGSDGGPVKVDGITVTFRDA